MASKNKNLNDGRAKAKRLAEEKPGRAFGRMNPQVSFVVKGVHTFGGGSKKVSDFGPYLS